MNPIEASQRQKVVAAARGWVGTPYHHGAMVRGAGVDCLTLIAASFTEAGLIEKPTIPYYPPDFMLHNGTERYLEGVLGYAREIPGEPMPGDVVMWKFGRCFSHAAIVVDWPQIIHAYVRRPVTQESASSPWLTTIGESGAEQGKPRPVRFLSYWGR